MSENRIYGRAVQKHDTEANWLKATNFTPMKGEIIIYDPDETYAYPRQKVGDGVTLVSNLPFLTDALDDKKVNKEDISTLVSMETITCTLFSSGWLDYTQSINIENVTAEKNIIITPTPDDYINYYTFGVYGSTQGNGYITFSCLSQPLTDLVVQIMILEQGGSVNDI